MWAGVYLSFLPPTNLFFSVVEQLGDLVGALHILTEANLPESVFEFHHIAEVGDRFLVEGPRVLSERVLSAVEASDDIAEMDALLLGLHVEEGGERGVVVLSVVVLGATGLHELLGRHLLVGELLIHHVLLHHFHLHHRECLE